MKLHYIATCIIAISATALHLQAAPEESQSSLKAEAKITEEAAQKTAMAAEPQGKIKDSELEREDGKLVWSFDMSKPDTKDITEVQVDAKTGQIVSTKVETEADQAKEKAQDKAEKADKD